MTAELVYIFACAAGVVAMNAVLLACVYEDGANKLVSILSGIMSISFAIIAVFMCHKTIAKNNADETALSQNIARR